MKQSRDCSKSTQGSSQGTHIAEDSQKFYCQITFCFKITSVLEGKKEKDSQVEDGP